MWLPIKPRHTIGLLNKPDTPALWKGQRSSAMLPLIALVEDAPLIVDQPEDNLDNRLVGRMLVDILANLKEKRQIIVATHNPNIVVSGDAEQVIVLDTGYSFFVCHSVPQYHHGSSSVITESL